MRRGKEERQRREGKEEGSEAKRREEGIGRARVWDEEMEGRPIRGREDLSTDDGCADSKG